jgi:Domain of unknown function (DUF4440)
MFRMLFSVLLLCICAHAESASDLKCKYYNAAEEELLRLDRRRMERGDPDVLQQLLDDRYTLIGSDGKLYRKAHAIHHPDNDEQSGSVTESDLRVYGNNAIIIDHVTFSRKAAGKPIVPIRCTVTNVYVRERRHWKAVASQATVDEASQSDFYPNFGVTANR